MITNHSSLPAPAYIWNYAEKNNVEPGETAQIITGTSAKDLFLIQEINKEKTTDNRTTDDSINKFKY